MQTNEFGRFAKIQSGVKTVPAKNSPEGHRQLCSKPGINIKAGYPVLQLNEDTYHSDCTILSLL